MSSDHTVVTSKCVYECQINTWFWEANFTYFIWKLSTKDFIYSFMKALCFGNKSIFCHLNAYLLVPNYLNLFLSVLVNTDVEWKNSNNKILSNAESYSSMVWKEIRKINFYQILSVPSMAKSLISNLCLNYCNRVP